MLPGELKVCSHQKLVIILKEVKHIVKDHPVLPTNEILNSAANFINKVKSESKFILSLEVVGIRQIVQYFLY